MSVQYAQISLGSGRLYTYENSEAEDLKPGDRVRVTLPSGSTMEALVESLVDKPSFPCKPCMKVRD